jgi:hypothetical protein
VPVGVAVGDGFGDVVCGEAGNGDGVTVGAGMAVAVGAGVDVDCGTISGDCVGPGREIDEVAGGDTVAVAVTEGATTISVAVGAAAATARSSSLELVQPEIARAASRASAKMGARTGRKFALSDTELWRTETPRGRPQGGATARPR